MITSTSNPQVKNLLQLQKKSKVRNEEQVFIRRTSDVHGSAARPSKKSICF